MNAKYVVALILALQVSTSLCEIPQPSQDLVDKYANMKNTFFARVRKLYEKASAAANAQVEGNEGAAAARARIAELQNNPEFKAFVEVLNNLYAEVSPAVDTARGAVLGTYEQNLRPHIGQQLNDAIDVIKAYLDKVMPAQ